MNITIPELCLVVLVGASGSGKSTFARTHFKPTEILSSDFCRGLVSDDENSQDATNDAFDVLQYIAGKRLARGLLTVIDATNVQPEAREPLLQLAREHDVLPVVIVLNVPEKICVERNKLRADRDFPAHVIRNHISQLRRSMRGLQREGFRYVFQIDHEEASKSPIEISRQPLWNNRKSDTGPFDIIGDIHGCFDELSELLHKLGYTINEEAGDFCVTRPGERKIIFLGDFTDRGPNSPQVLRLAMSMVRDGSALCVPGNHDVKLMKQLQGRNVLIAHGLEQTLEQLKDKPGEFLIEVEKFIDRLIGHYVLDGGKLVVAHAGMKQQYIGRASNRVREFALYGETTGETDEFGLPERLNWAAEYRGNASVVYGHTPVEEADWLNRTINIDTGCVFGGKLTALRWPEREIISVPAKQAYAEPKRKLTPSNQSLQQSHDDVLDIDDVLGKRIIKTRLHHSVTVREENAIAALEIMSRFAADPRWLIYLPPTMSPTETTTEPGLLEHPREALEYFKSNGVAQVVCQEKHMGSRAVVIVCRDEETARKHFGIQNDGSGIIYTRTGRRFFEDRATEAALLSILRESIQVAGLWEELSTDWMCLDCELMPWSAKAQELLRRQYAAVGSASRWALADVVETLKQAGSAHESLVPLLEEHEIRRKMSEQFVTSYRQYCWPVNGVADYKLAPFHLLASEGAVHVDKNHLWHMTTLARLARPQTPIIATPFKTVDLANSASIADAINWWQELTGHGGEGMVVKPLDFVVRGNRGLLQPAIKCRGPEYLRIIYGPEYTAAQNLDRLRRRGLGNKRSLALRELALGIESLERFVRKEPLRNVHECVFGVLALESEPVDPRL